MKWHTIRDAQVTDKWETKGVCSVGRSYRRAVPVTTNSTCRPPQSEPTSPAPIENRSVRAIPGSHLRGVGLDLMLQGLQADLGCDGRA